MERKRVMDNSLQDDLHMTKEGFKDRFGDDPRKDDLTVLAPKQDDPTEQVQNVVVSRRCQSAFGDENLSPLQPTAYKILSDCDADLCLLP